MYDSDWKIFMNIKTSGDRSALEENIDRLFVWYFKNKLHPNNNK